MDLYFLSQDHTQIPIWISSIGPGKRIADFLRGTKNNKFKIWWGTIHSGQLREQNLKEERKTEKTQPQYSGSVKFNGISREGMILTKEI